MCLIDNYKSTNLQILQRSPGLDIAKLIYKFTKILPFIKFRNLCLYLSQFRLVRKVHIVFCNF